MTLAHPLFLWLFLGFSLLGLGFWWLRKRQKKTLALQIPFFQDLRTAERQSSRFSLPRILLWGKWIFFGCTIFFLSIALARPQILSEEKKISKNGVDILIALDVSESMRAEDLQPNRMEAAKKYIDGFISQITTDRVGLEVFAGKPFTQSPMSFDYAVIRSYLSEISTEMIDQQRNGLNGTALGDAIVAAINRFENSPERTKVLVLLTDGEANVGIDPILAAEHARSKGIKIYTIGLGNKEGAPIPIGERNGQKIYAKNSDGTLYKTPFDEETLKNIAQIANGEYFSAENNASLQQSFESINALEKMEYEAETSVNREDHFWIFLLLGFVSAVLSVGILWGESFLFSFLSRKES